MSNIERINILIRTADTKRDCVIIKFINDNKLYDKVNSYGFRINLSLLDENKEAEILKKYPNLKFPYMKCASLKISVIGTKNIIIELNNVIQRLKMNEIKRKQLRMDGGGMDNYLLNVICDKKEDNCPDDANKSMMEKALAKATELQTLRTKSLDRAQGHKKINTFSEEEPTVANDARFGSNRFGHNEQRVYQKISDKSGKKKIKKQQILRTNDEFSKNIPDELDEETGKILESHIDQGNFDFGNDDDVGDDIYSAQLREIRME